MTSFPAEGQDENGTNPQASALSYVEVNRSDTGVVNPVAPENVNSESTVAIRADPGVDADEAARFIAEVFGKTTGYIEIASFVHGTTAPISAFRRLGEKVTRDEDGVEYAVSAESIAEGIAETDRRGLDPKRGRGERAGIDAWYVCMTPLATEPVGFRRGGKGNASEIIGFWLDGDYAVAGHHKNDQHGGLPLPPDDETVMGIWTACGFPEPSATWHTGGGVNGLWLLDEPFVFTDDDEGRACITLAQKASERWHDRARRTAASMGWHHDTVPNLDRLMRLPGTVNRKVWTDPKPVTATYSGLRYSLADLLAIVPEPVETEDGSLVDPKTGEVVAPARTRIPQGRAAFGAGDGGITPWDDFDKRGDWWTDVLGPLGWSHARWAGSTEYVTRPGKNPRDGISATLNHDGTDKLCVFTEALAGVTTRKYLTKSQVWCQMAHGGDWRALAADLRTRGYGGEFTVAQLSAVPKAEEPPADAMPVMPTVPAPRPEEVASPDDTLWTAELVEAEETTEEGSTGDVPAGDGSGDKTGKAADDGGTGGQNTFSNPDAPMRVARELEHLWLKSEGRTLHHWRDTWMSWTGTRFAEVGVSALRSKLYLRLEHGIYYAPDREGKLQPKPWNPSMKKVANLVDAIAAVTHLDEKYETGDWLGGRSGPQGLISCKNVMVDPITRETRAHTPAYFTTTSVPYDYDPDARCPMWLSFMGDVFGVDQESIETLQEWAGYVLSGRTDLQKGVQLIGPPRAGKGTTARTCEKMIGRENSVGATLKGLGTNFGLQPLIGKSLCVIGDAQMENRNNSEIVARLLMITGEDSLTVDRKNRAQWSGKMSSRIMILANKPPRFSDASGAIVSRFITLQFNQSFLGKEDPTLEARLETELPGILNWALDGLARLTARGYFKQPGAAQQIIDNQRQESAPISAFIDQCCVTGEQEWISKEFLFAAWQSWCYRNNYKNVGTTASFATDLYAARAGLNDTRRRVNGKLTRMFTGITLATEPGMVCPPGMSHATRDEIADDEDMAAHTEQTLA